MGKTITKTFRVVRVSSNTNSFGLTQHLFVARDGEAWFACGNMLRKHKVGDEIEVPMTFEDSANWGALGYELPERHTDCPQEALAQIFGKDFNKIFGLVH